MTTISLKLPDDLAAALDEAARAKHVSRSEFFRAALTQAIEGGSEKKRGRSLFDRSRDLCGAGDSGMGDLSSNPKHLEGFGS